MSELVVEAAIEQHQESESGRLDSLPLALPGIRILAGRIVEPEAGIRKCLPQNFQVLIARILIAIEAEVALLRRRAADSETYTAKNKQFHNNVTSVDFKRINQESPELSPMEAGPTRMDDRFHAFLGALCGLGGDALFLAADD